LEKITNKNVDIVISWRIGDALLNLPMLCTLKNLNEKFKTNLKVRVVTQPFLAKLYKPLDVFEVVDFDIKSRIMSHIFTPDIVFFLETRNVNLGYKAKTSYGYPNPSKKLIKFDKPLNSINIDIYKEELSPELVEFLEEKSGLSSFAVSLFGVIKALGFTDKEIIENYDFGKKSFNTAKFTEFPNKFTQKPFIVICMEAAYGRKGDAYRCWNENNYIEIAQKIHDNFGLNSVFIGIDKSFVIPKIDYLLDLRKRLDLFQLAQVMKQSSFYIGNDTGPFHIFNIMQKSSIVLYFREKSLQGFKPLFPERNTAILFPENTDQIYKIFENKWQEINNEKI